jgi:hypothetical protein
MHLMVHIRHPLDFLCRGSTPRNSESCVKLVNYAGDELKALIKRTVNKKY